VRCRFLVFGASSDIPLVMIEDGLFDGDGIYKIPSDDRAWIFGGVVMSGWQFSANMYPEALIDGGSQFDFIDGGNAILPHWRLLNSTPEGTSMSASSPDITLAPVALSISQPIPAAWYSPERLPPGGSRSHSSTVAYVLWMKGVRASSSTMSSRSLIRFLAVSLTTDSRPSSLPSGRYFRSTTRA
jgi:hypothetical protein